MHSLHEFLSFTKGTEYLLAIVAMALFPIFWELLDWKKKRKLGQK
jgi:hypothetical protein